MQAAAFNGQTQTRLPLILTAPDILGVGAFGRMAMVFFGIVMCIAALGLWAIPTAMLAETLVLRVSLTCLLVGFGYSLFSRGWDGVDRLDVTLDLHLGEVRHIQRSPNGMERVIDRFDLAGLGFFDIIGTDLVAETCDGVEVLRLPVDCLPESDEVLNDLRRYRRVA